MTMKVNLYYAPYPSQVFRGENAPISPVRVWNPKSALVTLATGVEQHLNEWGIEDVHLEIIDTQVEGKETYYKSINYGPKILDCYRVGGDFNNYNDQILGAKIHGISNNYTNSAGIVTDFAKHIRSVNPESIIVVGGMDATARPEFYIDNGFDIVIKLEGEYSFSKVIEAIVKGKPLKEALPCSEYHNGLIINATPVLDMNLLLPMNYSLIKHFEMYTDTGEGSPPSTVKPPFACLETSRGCYQRCSFCATPSRGRYRYMTISTIRKHFEYYKQIGISNIVFQEDNILSRMQRTGRGDFIHDTGRDEVIEIFEMAREFEFSWEFANGLEFGKFLDSGKIDFDLMKSMFWNDMSGERWKGCYRVQIPLEELSESPSTKLPKLRKFSEQLEIIKSILDCGINFITFNVIIGNDGDDNEKLNLYLKRCLELKEILNSHNINLCAYFNIFNRTLLPGTLDFKMKSNKLEFDINKDPEVISVYLSPMGTETLSYYDLVERRISMTSLINGDLIDQYDGTYHKVSSDIKIF